MQKRDLAGIVAQIWAGSSFLYNKGESVDQSEKVIGKGNLRYLQVKLWLYYLFSWLAGQAYF